MGEWFDFWREEIRIAIRKPQECGECGEEIPIGASYFRVIGVSEGRFSVHKTCFACQEDWEDVLDRDWSEGIICGGLLDLIEENINILEEDDYKDDYLIQKWLPRIQKRREEIRQRRFNCPLQAIGLK